MASNQSETHQNWTGKSDHVQTIDWFSTTAAAAAAAAARSTTAIPITKADASRHDAATSHHDKSDYQPITSALFTPTHHHQHLLLSLVLYKNKNK